MSFFLGTRLVVAMTRPDSSPFNGANFASSDNQAPMTSESCDREKFNNPADLRLKSPSISVTSTRMSMCAKGDFSLLALEAWLVPGSNPNQLAEFCRALL